MEANARWITLTAIAPIAWGATYFVTRTSLPADYPFYGGVLRALPAGFLLLLVTRELPRGSWWWRSAVLGAINFGAFFTLIYIASQLLPASVASTLMATSSVTMMLVAWPLLAQRPQFLPLVGAAIGIGGVALMLLGEAGGASYWGALASLSAMLMTTVGQVLTARWSPDVNILSLTAWQSIAGGVLLLPISLAVEGAPPAMTTERVAAYAYCAVIATALAYVVWFQGLRHLSASTVGLIGLLNPVTGVLLGVLVGSESFGTRQWIGLVLVFAGILLGQPVARRLFKQPDVPGSTAPPSARQAEDPEVTYSRAV